MSPLLWNIIYILAFLAVIGFISFLINFFKLKKELTFTILYLRNYAGWINSKAEDKSLYLWLTEKMPQMQFYLGTNGYVTEQVNGKAEVYQFLPNALPDINRLLPAFISSTNMVGGMLDEGFAKSIPPMPTIFNVEEMLVRFKGIVEMKITACKSEMFNPIKSVLAGIDLVLNIPLSIFGRIFSMTYDKQKAISESALYKVAMTIALFLIGFYSNIVTIITGHSEAWKTIKALLGLDG